MTLPEAGAIVRFAMNCALDDIRVIDLSQAMAGQLVGMMLGDNGADVIKIDPPGRGDSNLPGELAWNRGKKRVTLGLKSPKAKDAFLKLVATADVLVEDFSPGATALLGIDYEALAPRNTRLVYTTITGYGSSTTLKHRPGYDALVQARIGVQVEQDQHAAQPAVGREGPIMLGLPLPSIGAFFFATYATLGALIAREITGEGQHVETSLFQGMLGNMTMRWWGAERGSSAGPGSIVNGVHIPWLPTIFESKDGVWFFTMGTRRFREEYSEWLGLKEGYQAIPADIPVEEQHRVYHQMAEHFLQYDWEELDEIFQRLDCIVLPAQDASKAFDDPQIQHNGFIAEVEDARYGRLREVGVPFSMFGTPPEVKGWSSKPGADTESVLLAAGLTQRDVMALRDADTI